MVVKNKKLGFTLAEIMLTLSMIGILATLTVSTIGGSIQQRARQSEFRAAYAKLESALRSITIDEGKIYRCYAIPTGNDKATFGLTRVSATNVALNDCSAFEEAFSKALGRVKTCESSPQTNGCIPNNYPEDTNYYKKNDSNARAYVMDNGMILWVGTQGIAGFVIDINGRSAPNKWGQDLFPFMIKVTETKTIGDKIYPVSIGILPPPPTSDNYQPPVTGSGKTTWQLMLESANYKK